MSNKRKNRGKRKGVVIRVPWNKYLFDQFWNDTQHGRFLKASYDMGRSLARRMNREERLILEAILK